MKRPEKYQSYLCHSLSCPVEHSICTTQILYDSGVEVTWRTYLYKKLGLWPSKEGFLIFSMPW